VSEDRAAPTARRHCQCKRRSSEQTQLMSRHARRLHGDADVLKVGVVQRVAQLDNVVRGTLWALVPQAEVVRPHFPGVAQALEPLNLGRGRVGGRMVNIAAITSVAVKAQ
jgi:hypothetical protein